MKKKEAHTAKLITEALLRLLDNHEYHSITVQDIVDEAKFGRRTFYWYFSSKDEVLKNLIDLYMSNLADYFEENPPNSMEEISLRYFSYWERNIEFLLTMQKAGLIHLLYNCFEDTVHEIARRLNHTSAYHDSRSASEYHNRYKFAFGFRLAGYWKVTEMWLGESPRKSVEEISLIINTILSGQNS